MIRRRYIQRTFLLSGNISPTGRYYSSTIKPYGTKWKCIFDVEKDKLVSENAVKINADIRGDDDRKKVNVFFND